MRVSAAVVAGLLIACGGAQTPTDAEEELAQQIASDVYERLLRDGYLDCAPEPEESTHTAEVEPAAVDPDPTPPTRPSSNQRVVLSPGFVPDPHLVSGSAGGPKHASDFGAHCVGSFSEAPNHVVEAQSDFDLLRFVVNSDQDTTLTIRKPDGSVVCNDDTDGLNPVISGAMPAGNYSIWVGSYAPDTFPTYTLGISELNSTTSSSLP